MWWLKDWENVSGSIPETEVSPVKQDTDIAPDIGRANHDYSCFSNADSRWGATRSGLENWTGTGWQRLIRRYRKSIVCVKEENFSKRLATFRRVNIIYIHTAIDATICGKKRDMIRKNKQIFYFTIEFKIAQKFWKIKKKSSTIQLEASNEYFSREKQFFN